MKSGSIVTRGIILARTNFQEADRIVTILTPDHGKVKLMVKGARRQASKLAPGIELFSVSQITYLPGSREIGTLVSSRLEIHYGDIVKDIERTMLGYELLKRINRVTEDEPGEEYFHLLQLGIAGLNDEELTAELVELWFCMQLLKISGHSPNLINDPSGSRLQDGGHFAFDFDDMYFHIRTGAPYGARHIKLLRLAAGLKEPAPLKQISKTGSSVAESLQLAKSMLGKFLRI